MSRDPATAPAVTLRNSVWSYPVVNAATSSAPLLVGSLRPPDLLLGVWRSVTLAPLWTRPLTYRRYRSFLAIAFGVLLSSTRCHSGLTHRREQRYRCRVHHS